MKIVMQWFQESSHLKGPKNGVPPAGLGIASNMEKRCLYPF